MLITEKSFAPPRSMSPVAARVVVPLITSGPSPRMDPPAKTSSEPFNVRTAAFNRTSDTVVRLLPPYVITAREIDEALPLLEAAIATVVEAPRS